MSLRTASSVLLGIALQLGGIAFFNWSALTILAAAGVEALALRVMLQLEAAGHESANRQHASIRDRVSSWRRQAAALTAELGVLSLIGLLTLGPWLLGEGAATASVGTLVLMAMHAAMHIGIDGREISAFEPGVHIASTSSTARLAAPVVMPAVLLALVLVPAFIFLAPDGLDALRGPTAGEGRNMAWLRSPRVVSATILTYAGLEFYFRRGRRILASADDASPMK